MRYIPAVCLFLLFSAYCAAGQVLPESNGSCSVSPSGLERCEWMGGVKSSKLFVTRYILAPGAPLNPPVEGHDAGAYPSLPICDFSSQRLALAHSRADADVVCCGACPLHSRNGILSSI